MNFVCGGCVVLKMPVMSMLSNPQVGSVSVSHQESQTKETLVAG